MKDILSLAALILVLTWSSASFAFDEKGKYRVICLFEVDGKKREVKFWYPSG